MFLFLDFDGVLHHKDAAGREIKPRDTASLDTLTEDERRFIDNEGRFIVGKNLFCHADRLASTLQPFASVQIVIASTWRNYFSLDKLKSFLPATLADRVVGVTPRVFSRDGAFVRSREISAYFSTDKSEDWLALDDHAYMYCDYEANHKLVLCDGERGFDDAVADVLLARLTDMKKEFQ